MAEQSADIYRVNKLLEIEHADWERQLKQAVSYHVVIPYSLAIDKPPPFKLNALLDFNRASRIPPSVYLKQVTYSITMSSEPAISFRKQNWTLEL